MGGAANTRDSKEIKMANGLTPYKPSADIMGSYKNALQVKGIQNALAFQSQQQAMETQRFGWEKENQERLKALDPIVKMTSFTNFVRQQAPSIKWNNYPQAREYLTETAEGLGLSNFTLPAPEEIAQEAMSKGMMPEQYFEQWKDSTLRTAEERIKEMTAQTGLAKALRPEKQKWSAPQKGLDENGNPIVYQVDEQGNPRIIQGVKPQPTKGMKIYDRDGNLIVDTTGGTEAGGMTKKTQGAIEEKILGGKEQLARMEKIAADFRPEFLEIGPRLGATITGIKAKLGREVSPEDTGALIEFKTFQRKAIENINLYIHEMTGAQMSVQEADRLKLAQPDPGESWWKGDDPITFRAKMNDVLKMTRAAVARYEYYRSKGLADSQIKAMINEDKAVSLESIANRM